MNATPATFAEKAEHLLSGDDALGKVRQLLGQFRSAMLTTATTGVIHTRPMGLLGKASEFNGTLWFFTDERSLKMGEVRAGEVTALIFQSDSDNAYLQLNGRATAVRDPERMKALYTPILRTWFPEGLDDPYLILLRFDAHSGHYWDSPGGMLRVLAAFTKAVITGERAEAGESGQVRLL